MVSYFELSILEKLNNDYNKLLIRIKLIQDALIDLLNFESYKHENKYFYDEINNYLDIFISEANLISFESDIVIIAKYIQYIRDNLLRGELIKIYNNILGNLKVNFLIDTNLNEHNSINFKYEMFKLLVNFNNFNIKDYNIKINYNNKLDINNRCPNLKAFVKKYNIEIKKDLAMFDSMGIPSNICVKELALHPQNLDYVRLPFICSIDYLLNDLNIATESLKKNEIYGLRNIHDRIYFLFSKCKYNYIILLFY